MTQSSDYQLRDGSRVAVIGGGPAGAFFATFLLDMAGRASRQISVDIYEPRDFNLAGPKGCNGCAGIVSETLVQMLAAEGVNLPPTVVQRGIDSYVMHMDVGSAVIDTPLQEKRIGAVYRGAGPRDLREVNWTGLDAHLLSLATDKGATVISQRVTDVTWVDGRPQIGMRGVESEQPYDLLAVTAGVNTPLLKLFSEGDLGYQPPETTKTFLREYYLGAPTVEAVLGNAIQVFLLDIPRLEFGMLIPKGEYMTVCLLGEDIDNDLVQAFLRAPEVQRCLPEGMVLDNPSCQCAPRINTVGAVQPYGDRLVFIGDAASTRLFKDGVGSAYRTAKVAASTAIFHGVSRDDFQRHYLPACQAIENDNQVGRLIFAVVSQVQKRRFARNAVLQMILDEQGKPGPLRRMSAVQWDMYTGSGSYKDILMRTLHPAFMFGLAKGAVGALLPAGRRRNPGKDIVETPAGSGGDLGRLYQPGDVLIRQGEISDHMLVFQEGQVALMRQEKGEEVFLGVRGAGEMLGETAIFQREEQDATVQALSQVRVLSVDKENFLKRIHDDPSLAFHLFQLMSRRVHEMDQQVAVLNQEIDRLTSHR